MVVDSAAASKSGVISVGHAPHDAIPNCHAEHDLRDAIPNCHAEHDLRVRFEDFHQQCQRIQHHVHDNTGCQIAGLSIEITEAE